MAKATPTQPLTSNLADNSAWDAALSNIVPDSDEPIKIAPEEKVPDQAPVATPPPVVEEKVPAPEPEKKVETVVEDKKKFNPLLAEKTEDKKPVTEEDEIPKSGKEIGAAMKQFRMKQKELEENLAKELAEKSSLAEKLKSYETVQTELENLRKQNAEYEDILSVVKLESTRRYKELFGAPQEKLTADITTLAKTYEVDPEEVLSVLTIKDENKRKEKLNELAVAWDQDDRFELKQAAKKFDELRKGADEIKSQAKDALRILQENEEKQAKTLREKFEADADKSFEETFRHMQETIPFLRKIEGQPEHNQRVDDMLIAAKKLDRDPNFVRDHTKRAQVKLQAFALPMAMELYKDAITQLQEEVKKAKDEAALYRGKAQSISGATPGAGSTSTVEAAVKKVEEAKTFADAIDAMVAGR